MGVTGLWDVLRPAAETRSLTHLAVVDGFEANPSGVRGLRIGIDASIWFFHAAYGREGENPELRTLFFRCTRLMSSPFLPLFVFDGPKRPNVKRGKRISGNQHWLTNGMKSIIEAFGFEWRMAPGEAEAELAYMNRIGMIDAILSDDVDNFLFGAIVVIRNPSSTLTGNRAHNNKNADGREDGNHSAVYTARAIHEHSAIQLTRGGLILIGLLSGGDYHQAGLPRCGTSIAHGLAKCGFGDQLLEAARTLSRSALEEYLVKWRDAVRAELRTNARGHLGKRQPALSKAVPEDFPDVDVLLSYTNPITSETDAGARRTHVRPTWAREPDLGKIAHLCEVHFEWGIKEVIVKRFRTVLWPSAVLRILRRAVLERDEKEGRDEMPRTPRKKGKEIVIGTPSKMLARHFSSLQLENSTGDVDDDADDGKKLIVKIHSSRTHASTDGILEYRLEIAPEQLVRMSDAGIQGIRKAADTTYDVERSEPESDEDGEEGDGKRKKSKSAPVDPNTHLRMWLPACMVVIVRPDLVDQFEALEEKKRAKRAHKGTRAVAKSKGGVASGSKASRGGKQRARLPPIQSDEGETFDLDAEIASDDSEDGAPAVVKKTTTKATLDHVEQLSTKDLPRVRTKASKIGTRVPGTPTASVPSSPTKGKGKTSAMVRVDFETIPFAELDPDLVLVDSVFTKSYHGSAMISLLEAGKDRPRKPSTYRKPSLPATSSVIRPFPMAFEEEEESSSGSSDSDMLPLPLQPHTSVARPPPHPRRRPDHSRPSDSDCADRFTKSPRKHTKHTSPRELDPHRDRTSGTLPSVTTKATPTSRRSNSPALSPCRSHHSIPHRPHSHSRSLAHSFPKANTIVHHMATTSDTIIEISSDSDLENRFASPPRPQRETRVGGGNVSVFEISSSDSDSTVHLPKTRSPFLPLLAARRRMRAGGALLESQPAVKKSPSH